MTKTITFFNPHRGTTLGTWTLNDDGTITAESNVADILEAALRVSDGDHAAAWERYRSWSNGYVSSQENEAPTTLDAILGTRPTI